MRWNKKQIDKMEMLHILGIIYARTAAGFGKVSLCKIIKEEGKPSVRSKVSSVVKALEATGLLLYEGFTIKRRYKWNFKDFGAVSIPIAEMMVHEVENQIRIRGRRYYHEVLKQRNRQ